MLSKVKMKRIAFGLFAVAIAASSGEGAAHAQYASPPPPVIYTWNGGYVGLNAGVAAGADALSTTGTMTAYGFNGGVLAGYNWQIGGLVLGTEGDLNYVGLNGTQDGAGGPFGTVPEHDSFETTWLSTARARVGYGWGGWLFYVTGGLAVGDHKFNGVTLYGVANPSGNVIKVGWSAGLGSEWMFAPGWSTKIEYLHADLGTETFSSSGLFAFTVTGHLTEDIVRLGLNYKFGW
jgi:outer membrane immunogenic protein